MRVTLVFGECCFATETTDEAQSELFGSCEGFDKGLPSFACRCVADIWPLTRVDCAVVD